MATLLQKANDIVRVLDSSVDTFFEALPASEKKLYSEILSLIKELKVTKGNIAVSVTNIRLINKLRPLIENVLQRNKHLKDVGAFIKTYDTVTKAQNEYFSLIASKFKPPKLLKEVKKQAINETIDGLTERGLGNVVTDELTQILKQNIESGGSYAKFTEQLRESILGTPDEDGIMARNSRTFVTDTLNQYSATYSKTITDDLGLVWYQYVGSLITTSREFCIHLVGKRYVHESEITGIINGKIDGEKVSLAGLIPDTTKDNFPILRGGYNCRHQMLAVSEATVPKKVRIELYEKQGIEFDEDGFAV